MLFGLLAAGLVVVAVRGALDGMVMTREESFSAVVQELIEAAEHADRGAFDSMSTAGRVYEGPIGEGLSRQEELMAELFGFWEGASEVAIDLRDVETAVVGRSGHLSADFRIMLRQDGEAHGFQADLVLRADLDEEEWLVEYISIADVRHTTF